MSFKTVKQAWLEFLQDEEGASGIEYALVAAMVAVVLVAFVPGIGEAIQGIFTKIEDCIGAAAGAEGCS